MNKLNNIFMNTDPITNEELQSYISGVLSPSEKHAIELKLSSSDLYTDALEGLDQSSNALAGFAVVQDRFQNEIMGDTSLSTIEAGGSGAFGQTMGICLAISLITLLGLSIGNEQQRHNTNQKQQHVSQNILVEPIKYKDEIKHPLQSEEVMLIELEEELKTASPVPQNRIITYQKTKDNQIDNPIEEEVKSTQKTQFKKGKEVLNPVPINTRRPKPTEATPLSNMKLVYLHNLKAIDVSNFYTKKIKVRNMKDWSGTRVYNANTSRDNLNPSIGMVAPYVYVDYMKYLNDALELFENDNYKQALKAFKIIINSYAVDVNAHFYGALCYYNLGKPEKAIEFFNLVTKDQINSFDQEAALYIALSYAQAGDKEQAKSLLTKIQEEGNFYAKRATEELRKL